VGLACSEEQKPLVFAISCEVYGDSVQSLTEDSPMYPTNPYAASKLASEKLLYSFHKCYGLDLKIPRIFNPYGPHQQLNKIIPTFYRQAKVGKPITVYGNGTDTRDYVYVEDIAKALWEARRLPSGEAANIATGVATTNPDVARMIANETNSESVIKFTLYPKIFGGIRRQVGSRDKAEKLLGWQPRIQFAEGLRRTIQWLASVDE
jgi:UDP-glucose 4-epimerase